MRSAWFRTLGLAGIAGWLAIGTVGMTTSCATSREDINRVQPDYILKADLVGDYRDLRAAPEWYLRNLIIGVERTNPYFSDGLQDLMRRVRFDIEENYLVIRQSYEEIVGTDGHGGYAPNTEQYTVATGDTLDTIAAAFGTKSDTILAANQSTITDPNNLSIGNVLTIPGNANTGTIVAMYPITSHFDIKRSYNPATGELTNIIDENTTDRRWYEREYMRIDWSKNLVVDPSMFTFWYPQEFGQLNLESVAFYENDPTKPDASNFGEMSTGYFDLTQRWLIKPEMVDFYGSKVPQCLLTNYFRNVGAYVQGTVTCDDQEVVIRSSFMKVPTGDQATDYEVAETNGQQLQIVGTLDLQRFSYDRQYGVVDQTWHQYIQRYNLWQKSHNTTACGQDNNQANGDNTCSGVDVNSVCDLNAKLCTLPYTQRQIRPIVYFADPETPNVLLPATFNAVDIWNQALRNAVATARETECRRAPGGDRTSCHGQHFKPAANNPVQDTTQFNPAYPDVPADSIGKVAVFCNNPVQATDDPACGAPGFSVRKGDIRHHMIAWWSNPSYESPLGVVVWPGDPLTGENVNTMINIFGGTFDHAIPYYRDMIQLVNGDVSPSEFAAGVPVELYGSAQPTFNTDPVRDPSLDALFFSTAPKKRVGGGMSKPEMDRRMAGIHAADTSARLGIAAAAKGATSISDRLLRIKEYLNAQGVAGTPGFGGVTEFAARSGVAAAQAQKAGLEAKYVAGDYAAGFGFSPDQLSDPTILSAISPLEQLSPAVYRQIHDVWDNHWNSRACLMPDGLENLDWGHFEGAAAYFQAKYPNGSTIAAGHIATLAGVAAGTVVDRVVRGKMIAAELYEPVYTTVVIHEMGHAMSEDHDFAGSWDSPNFFPEYWQLRTNNGQSTGGCDATKDGSRAPTDPDTCMGPRYMDPKTTDELGTT
ncbi:MAG: LysM peptidoglycan-binding domain-containing protein, partial [Polyangiales bacterium]